MKLLRRVLLAPNEAPVPVTSVTGTLAESVALLSFALAAEKMATVATESAIAAFTALASPLTLTVANPADGSSTSFPFTATGTATKGATVRVYNTVNSALLGTTVADVNTGNWSIQINSL
jgi:hypothetical protein